MPRPRLLVALLLLGHAGLLAWSAWRHSPTIDEVAHLPAGLSHWQLGRFNLYCVNPPLVRMVAALPLVAAQPKVDWSKVNQDAVTRPEFAIGREFIAAHGPTSFWYYTLGRWACIPFSLLGGYVCFRWARQMYGLAAGFLALVLWCCCPNILAHASLLTPDAGAAALGVAAAYTFWHWLKTPTWANAFFAGAVLGLAELTKMTWVILFPLWPLLWLVHAWPLGAGWCWRRRLRAAGQLAVILLLGVYVLNLGYGFDQPCQRLGAFHFASKTFQGPPDPERPGLPSTNRFADTWLAEVPVPFPKDYLLGIDLQKRDFEQQWPSYLRGEWRQRGWWYYYLYGLLIKVPLGIWVIFLLALILRIRERIKNRGCTRINADEAKGPSSYSQGNTSTPTLYSLGVHRRSSAVAIISQPTAAQVEAVGPIPTWRDELVLLAPALAVLALVSSQTGFNHHLRYVLPVFPFVYIWLGKVAAAPWWHAFAADLGKEVFPKFCWAAKAWHPRVLAWTAMAWAVAASLWVYPHSLSYFNELAGGPLGGHAHLVDSNIDWGQDLLYLKRWLDEHPEARPLHLAYFGAFDPRIAGLAFTLPPKGPPLHWDHGSPTAKHPPPPPGWYAVSVSMLRGLVFAIPDGQGGLAHSGAHDAYTYFLRLQPVARAGYGIYIYHVRPEDIERLKREEGT